MPKLGSISQRRLNAARLVGANAFAAFAQLATDMPEGYFGPSDTVTTGGAAYLAWLALATVGCLLGLWKEKAGVMRLIWLTLSVNIGVFIAALATSPVIPALTIIWNLTVLSWMLFPLRTRGAGLRDRRAAAGGKETLEHWLRKSGGALRHLLLVSLVLNVAVFGYRLSEQWQALALTLMLAIVAVALTLPTLWRMVREGRTLILLMSVPLILMAFFLREPQILLLLISLVELTALLILLIRAPIFHDLLDYFYESPAILVLVTFAALTLLGTLLLSLPAASATGEPVGALDAFFTATSAACVTGLIVLDTAADFSTFGHVIIIILVQLGGVGILVLSTFGALLLGSRLGLRAEHALEETLGIRGARSTYELTIFIVVSTLVIEVVGAAGLYFSFRRLGFGVGEAVWQGLFYSISAFCHAGFALDSRSVGFFSEDPFALMILTVLITLGSAGFLVLAVAWQWIRGRRPRVNAQTRIIVGASAALLALGFVLFMLCEWNASMAEMGAVERIFNALLQSATLRSAGFSSVDPGLFTDATIWFSICLMIVGGAPGSTAGGIKVTTLVVMLLAVRGIAAGQARVVIFNREIPQEVVYRSAGIVILYLLLIFLFLFLLLLTQSLPFEMLAFEVASALGTVGISLGATPQLNAMGKALIIAVIFIGRVGPLALALVLGRGAASRLRYPRAQIMVG